MTKTNCPYCDAPLEIPDDLAGAEVTCPSCGEAFVASADEPQPPSSRPGPRPMPRQMPKPKRAPHPTIVGAGPRPALEDAIGESWRIVRQWAAIIITVAVACSVFFLLTDSPILLWLAILASSILPIWFMLWVMAYVRAIAKHTAR